MLYTENDDDSLAPPMDDERYVLPAGHGSPYSYDPTFHGPIARRRFTDVICLILFLVFILFWVVLGIFGFLNGHPKRLLHPADYTGKECGIEELSDKKFLYYFDIIQCAKLGISIIKGCPTTQVCVERCPNVTKVVTIFTQDKSWLVCKPDLDINIKQRNTPIYLVRMGYCAPYVISSIPLLGRCIPTVDKDLINVLIPQANAFTNYTQKDFVNSTRQLAKYLKVYNIGQQIFQDFMQFWWMYIFGLFFSMAVALVWIILMRWLAGFMVTLNFFIVVGLLSFGIYFCFDSWYRIKYPNNAKHINILPLNMQPDDIFADIIKDKKDIEKTWLIFGIILSSFLVLVIILTLIFLTRLRIAIALIREASKAIAVMLTTLFWPLIPFLLQICIIIFWAALCICLASTGFAYYQTVNIPDSWNRTLYASNPRLQDIYGQNNGVIYTANFTQCDPQLFKKQLDKMGIDPTKTLAACQFVNYEQHPWYIYMQIFNLFGLFWTIFFVNALNQITLAGAFSSYYWARNKRRDVPFFIMIRSFSLACIYHAGSLAFGSLLLAITKMIRLFLEYLKDKCEKSGNSVLICLLRCIRCLFWIFEKFLRFLNKNAFIMMAIHGKNFCQSAADAFSLLMRNVIRVVVINHTTDFLLFMGQLVVMATTGYFFYFLHNTQSDVSQLLPKFRVWQFSMAVQIIGAYFVSRIFFGVYEMAVDTLFLCFLEDCERNDGSPQKPYYMSKDLKRILHKKNQIVQS
ncbi:unnamed protein product [Gordionus sp. m RMFG-2023]|uniref:choline transporter-like protein 2 isoform X2 n=1 Tax=Gordionus sp. m RMFG-2023 TaxID=3053472 RepID=UPI0030E0E072